MRKEDSEYFKPLTEQWSTPNFEGGKKYSLTYRNGQYLAKYATFRNITFAGGVTFDNVYLGVGISFTNCTFESDFILINIRTSGDEKAFNDESESIIFSNCTFKSVFRILGNRNLVEKNLVFEKCNFEKGFYVENLKISLEGINFNECNIKVNLDLNNILFNSSINFKNCQLYCFSTFFNLNGIEIVFSEGNTLHDNLHIKECAFEEGIIFNYSSFKKDVWLRLVTAKKRGLSIFASHFEKSLLVFNHWQNETTDKGILKYYFESTNFQGGFTANGIEKISDTIPTISLIEINVSAVLIGNISFNNFDIGELKLEGFNTLTNIWFNNISIKIINISSFINKCGLVFSDLKSSINFDNISPSLLIVKNSNLGQAQFMKCDISNFGKIDFQNSIFSEITMSNMKWFKYHQLDNGEENELLIKLKKAKAEKNIIDIGFFKMSLINKYKSTRDIYRQIKIAYSNQGDTVEAIKYQSIEMDIYRKMVKLQYPPNYGDKFILWLGQTNDFGQNWLRALIYLLLISYLFYIPIGIITSEILIPSSPSIDIDDIENTIMEVYKSSSKWIILLNPTHNIKDLTTNLDGINKWIYFWDYLHRIITAFFIFQTVVAFRKFYKK